MLVLGLLLIVVAAAATGFAYLASNVGHSSVGLNAYGLQLGVSPLTIFLAGAVSLLLLLLGLALIRRGAARKARQRRELRTLRKQRGSTTSATTSQDTGPGSTSGYGSGSSGSGSGAPR